MQRSECAPLRILGSVAVACLLAANPAFGQDASAGFSQALSAFRAGDERKAVVLLEIVLKAHPDDAPSHELLGLSLSALGEESEALDHLQEAVELWPDQPVYWINLATFYLRQSRVDKAEKALKQSLNVRPSAPAFRLLGLIRLDQNVGEEAVQLFSKALGLAPDDVESWYYLGLAQQSLAHSEEALRCYQEALRRAPGDFHTQLQMGSLLLSRGQRPQALEHLRAAQVIRPENPHVYELLSETYMRSGNLEQALESARRAVDLKPDSRQAHYQLGLVLARLGKSDESQREFAIAETLPKKPETMPLDRWHEPRGEALRSNGPKP